MIQSHSSVSKYFSKIIDYVSYRRKYLFLLVSLAVSIFFLFFQESTQVILLLPNNSPPSPVSTTEALKPKEYSQEKWKQCMNGSQVDSRLLETCAEMFNGYEVSTFNADNNVKFLIITKTKASMFEPGKFPTDPTKQMLTLLVANLTMDNNTMQMVQASMFGYMDVFATDPLFTGVKIFDQKLKIFPHELRINEGIADSYNLTDMSYSKLILKEPSLIETHIPVNIHYFLGHLASRSLVDSFWVNFNTKVEAFYFLENFLKFVEDAEMNYKVCQLNMKVLRTDLKMKNIVEMLVNKSKKYVLLRYHQATDYTNYLLVNFADEECSDRYRSINY